MKKIVLLPGDGIGPEIVEQAAKVLRKVGERHNHDFHFEEHPIGGAAIDEHGDPLPAGTLSACKKADAILLGAVGGPKWSDPKATVRPEQGLLRIRKELGLFANLRPVRTLEGLEDASPLKNELVRGVDILIVRELTGGIYFGKPRERRERDGVQEALDTMIYSSREIERVARVAFEAAKTRKRRVTSIEKANVLESSRLWRETTTEVARDYPDIELAHQLVDSAAMKLVTAPADFDVIVTGNLFGDILSDEAAVLTGSLGTLPSASLGEGKPGLYEPIHGSAPDIAGQGKANPIGTILSAAMLLRHSLGLNEEAQAIEHAVNAAVHDKQTTADLGGTLSTAEAGDAIAMKL